MLEFGNPKKLDASQREDDSHGSEQITAAYYSANDLLDTMINIVDNVHSRSLSTTQANFLQRSLLLKQSDQISELSNFWIAYKTAQYSESNMGIICIRRLLAKMKAESIQFSEFNIRLQSALRGCILE
ncbi:hypothetical protein SS50377_20562 [Spironucleus salmonicida]|uniref:Uncharacterized protein n=1 Tax=Spironucleus salmonicida TaxID=348837 RepID=V6LUD6_9EUKA|nr:hypothetical protein SS50377_20560 [Spironucleus salmonicida]KAH0577211.1 hypothetical protein SS50377_20562 [Spironucleus salmonicida]|eukprot:EST48180.1 Hypothetical protein SS50377_11698 [Spironucleus salmonicida]